MNIDVKKLKPFVSAAQEQFLKDDFRIHACHTNRASSVGHPCARFLAYSRTHWQSRVVPDVHLMSIFKLGWDLEEIVFKWMKDRLKLDVIQPKDKDLSWPEHQLTGHMDFYVNEQKLHGLDAPLWIPWEAKGVAAGTWDTVSCWEDMKRSTRPWIAKWVGQLPIYLVTDEKPYGRFILFQKESGLLKDFPVILDENLDLVEGILKRLEIVNKAVASGTTPDRFFEPGPVSTLCAGCDFGHICLPGSSYDEALKQMIEPQIEQLLKEEQDLKDVIKHVSQEEKRLKAIGDQLKVFFTGKAKVLVGNFLVEGKQIDRKGQEPSSYWKRSVKVIGAATVVGSRE